ARKRIWLTDAYYAGTASYAQALRAAALEGVDVRLLLPGATDIPILRPLSRSGYRPLLKAGVRIYEWNGPMLHAKTAVVDGHWARVGSTNLNVASWLGNCELDVVVENEEFAHELEAQYLRDLENATEIVLAKRRVRPCAPRPRPQATGARAHPVAAGAARLSHSLGAAFTGRRELAQIEPRPTLGAALLLLSLAALLVLVPLLLVVPAVLVLVWIALSLLLRIIAQRQRRLTPEPSPECEEER
ncbi:MAG TPA: cardiolipin synthase B, partial [Myxococcales bacterium]|nr:cardiolipin synthase B [Myxococcales bacterium]